MPDDEDMPIPPGQTFAGVLAELLRSRRMSQHQLARRLGVTDTSVSSWMRQRSGIHLPRVWQIADIFGADRNTLARLAGYPDQNPSAGVDIDPAMAALLEAERVHAQAELGGIPPVFWAAIIDAGSVARERAAHIARLAAQQGPPRTPNDVDKPRKRRKAAAA